MLDPTLAKFFSFQIASSFQFAHVVESTGASDLAVTSSLLLFGSMIIPFAGGFASWFLFVLARAPIAAERDHLDLCSKTGLHQCAPSVP